LSSAKLREKPSPAPLAFEARQRTILQPLPSPGVWAYRLSAYQHCRPAPSTPDEAQEKSCIDWDDDDDPSRFTRLKKSLTDLRSRSKTGSPGSDKPKLSGPPTQPSKPSMEEISLPAFVQDLGTPRHSYFSVSPGKLSKDHSIKHKDKRSRGWSHTSTISTASGVSSPANADKYSKPSTPMSACTASTTSTALPAPQTSTFRQKKKRRFSVSGSRTGKKMSMGKLGRLLARMWPCQLLTCSCPS
jgi:hypothetical protein